MPVQKKCERCGIEYTCRPSKAAERKYCGRACTTEANMKYRDVEKTPKARRKRYQKEHRKKHPNKALESDAKKFSKYYNTSHGRADHMHNNARRRATEKNVEMTLTPEWIQERLAVGKCEVTGLPFILQRNGGKGHKVNSFSPSIDRIRQDGGYTPDNCRVVVWIYNRARGAFPDNDFDVMLSALMNKST